MAAKPRISTSAEHRPKLVLLQALDGLVQKAALPRWRLLLLCGSLANDLLHYVSIN